MKLRSLLFIFSFLVFHSLCFGQGSPANPVYYTIFDVDSLKGFDEAEARAMAISQGFLGAEFKIKMYRIKRNYINDKYNLARPLHTTTNYFAVSKPSAFAACTNEDFEGSTAGAITASNQVSGWILTGGYNGLVNSSSDATLQAHFPSGLSNPNSCNLDGCCPMPTAHSQIIDCSSGYVDSNIGPQYPIYSIFGTGTVSGASASNPHIASGLSGSKVLRINDGFTGDFSVEKLSKTFSVTANNAFFQYAFVSILAPGHTCCEADGFQVRVMHGNANTIVSCASFSVSAPSTLCASPLPDSYFEVYTGVPTNTNNPSFSNIYNRWKINAIDLAPFIGQAVTLEVIVTDCNAGGHFSCLYFDAQCSPINININATEIVAGDSVINYSTCDSIVNLEAQGNFTSYQWNGPGGITSANANLTATSSGLYILTLNQPGLCAPVTKTVNITLLQQTANVVSSSGTICIGSSAILTANGFTSTTWNTGNTTPSIYISPSVTTTYFVNGISLEGCPVSASVVQIVEDCAGIKSLSANNPSQLFPNPNAGEFTLYIENELVKGELSIETCLGQLVHKQAVQQGTNSIKTKGLAAGVYYYSITNGKYTVSKGKLKIE